VYFGVAERKLGDRATDPPLDPLRTESRLVLFFPFPPFLGAVRVADSHPDDGDGIVRARDRDDARDTPAGADDHVAADLLAKDPVRAPDVARLLGRDRRRLEAEARLADRRGRLEDDPVLGGAARLERKVVARELELEPDDVRREDPQRLLEELLPGLVPLEDDDRRGLHGRASLPTSFDFDRL
jgi:hypothetical protein